MNPTAFETMLRANAELLQYAAFAGALVILGVLEVAVAARRDAERRRRWPSNVGLTVINILVLGALPLSAIAVADAAARHGLGLLNHPSVPWTAQIGLGLLLRSLIGYGVHVAMHKTPFLWRIHRIHHTDTRIDVTTTVRVHPLEFAIGMAVVTALTPGLGLAAAALMLYELLDAAMAAFTHANIRMPPALERAIKLVLVTPAMHRLHHSAWQPETDSNYSATFSWWDRMFGTFRDRPADELASVRLGLDDADRSRADSLGWLLWQPFAPRTAIDGSAPADAVRAR